MFAAQVEEIGQIRIGTGPGVEQTLGLVPGIPAVALEFRRPDLVGILGSEIRVDGVGFPEIVSCSRRLEFLIGGIRFVIAGAHGEHEVIAQDEVAGKGGGPARIAEPDLFPGK